MVGHDLGVEVNLCEATDHLIEQVRLVELGDLLGELVALDEDFARVLGEALDVGRKIRGDVVGVVG